MERERERSTARVLGHRAQPLRKPVELAHVRLEVDTRDVLGGCDAVRAESCHDVVSVDAGRELDDVDEPRAPVIGVIGREWLYGVETGQQVRVAIGRLARRSERILSSFSSWPTPIAAWMSVQR